MTMTDLECDLNARGLTAALLHNGAEITTPGYRRVPIRNWKVTDTALVCVVRFGPYDAPFTFDSYAIVRDDTVKLVIPESEPATFPTRWSWEWTFELEPHAV